eukprot:scaffold158964_cov16-Tisochrysis_lutea.AAC.1
MSSCRATAGMRCWPSATKLLTCLTCPALLTPPTLETSQILATWCTSLSSPPSSRQLLCASDQQAAGVKSGHHVLLEQKRGKQKYRKTEFTNNATIRRGNLFRRNSHFTTLSQ